MSIDPAALDRWITRRPEWEDEEPSELDELAAERETAQRLLDDFDVVAGSLRAVLEGRGDDYDATVLRGYINGAGELGVERTADWDLLLRHRSTVLPGVS